MNLQLEEVKVVDLRENGKYLLNFHHFENCWLFGYVSGDRWIFENDSSEEIDGDIVTIYKGPFTDEEN